MYNASGNVLALYDNNGIALQQKEMPVYAAGRIATYNKMNNSFQYELADHLGNVQVVIGQSKTSSGQADVVYYSDYYPFGSPMTLANNDYRYGYQGQYAEADKETGWNNFELRMYDPVIGRWMSTDPYGQYASPYVGMGNNPVMGVDPDGGKDGWWSRMWNKVAIGLALKEPVAMYGQLSEVKVTGMKGMPKGTDLNPTTVGRGYFWTNYIGHRNPMTFLGKSDYTTPPKGFTDMGAMWHDQDYGAKDAEGFGSVLFDTNVIGADYKLVGISALVAINPHADGADRLRGVAVTLGIGVIALPKTIGHGVETLYHGIGSSLYNGATKTYSNIKGQTLYGISSYNNSFSRW